MAATPTGPKPSPLAQRAAQRILSGRPYTAATVKRLASSGYNVGSILRDTPGGGLAGAQAGQTMKQQQTLKSQLKSQQTLTRQRALVKRAQQRLAAGKGGQATLKRVAAPKGVSLQREQQLMKQYNGNVPENAR